ERDAAVVNRALLLRRAVEPDFVSECDATGVRSREPGDERERPTLARTRRPEEHGHADRQLEIERELEVAQRMTKLHVELALLRAHWLGSFAVSLLTA